MKAALRYILLALLMLLPALWATATTGKPAPTVKQQMEWLHRERELNFVYDARLNVNRPYRGPRIDRMTVEQALQTLFDGTGIEYRREGNYVMLKEKAAPPEPKAVTRRRHTVSGYVRDSAGETLINATVYDRTGGAGTTTNEYGFFSLTLPEGPHRLRFSYIGFEDHEEELTLEGNIHRDVRLTPNARLAEVVVTGDLNSPLLTTQTGKRSLTARELNTGYALLSSPDVVKTLQRTSGVCEGMELMSGMYVHGGDNDENLFLMDGSPLYQINHTMGLFSAFNTDMVKNIDFYKSGFPARYSGRLSSVVDVRTNDGDMQRSHGSYRIGLLDGSLHLEGPIKRGTTSYNIGLRRSWIDLLTRPLFALVNHGKDDERYTINYFFHDLNAKVTHIFNDRSRIYLSLYSGEDKLKVTENFKWSNETAGISTEDNDLTRFKWGNFNAALNWNYLFSPRLFANFTAVYTHNRARYESQEESAYHHNDGSKGYSHHLQHSYRSTISDVGYRATFDFRPTPRHHISFGHDYTLHRFHPQTSSMFNSFGVGSSLDTLSSKGSNRHTSHETNLYVEDEMTATDRLSVNIGVNANLFGIGRKAFRSADPRMAVKYQAGRQWSVKGSFTMMTQNVHKISNSILDLPTDYWVPTTERLRPMRSWQLAAGIYAQPVRRWTFSLEGYYKESRHLLQYSSWTGIEPPAEEWDRHVMDGRGRFYGIEFDAHCRGARLTMDFAYTLSWNKRYYGQLLDRWFYDKFDNRHKLSINAQYRMGKGIYAYAGWTCHSGNRMTLPTHYTALPSLGEAMAGEALLYTEPNNFRLPAYHRLDIGCDFHHTTRRGHERIWNVSLYNVYCHLNSLWVTANYDTEQKCIRLKNHAYIPIVPSFSYTFKF